MDVTSWLLLICITIILMLLLGVIPSMVAKHKAKVTEEINKNTISSLENEARLNAKSLVIEELKRRTATAAQELATSQFETWKTNELENHRKVIIEAALERAKAVLAAWKIDEEKKLRKDAVSRSMGVNFGKITEHLLPFSVHLSEFDPRDIRFIGSPVDLMIFSGATAKKSMIDIYFVEIKTGTGQLSKKQKSIRDAIDNQRVYWKPIVVPDFKWDVSDEDNEQHAEQPVQEVVNPSSEQPLNNDFKVGDDEYESKPPVPPY